MCPSLETNTKGSGAEALASLRRDAASLQQRGEVLASCFTGVALGQAFLHRWMLGLATPPADTWPLAWIWPLLAAITGALVTRRLLAANTKENYEKTLAETTQALHGTNLLSDLLAEDAYERLSSLGRRPAQHEQYSFRRRIRDLARNFKNVAVQAGWVYPEEKKQERNGCLMLLELYWQTWVWPILKGAGWALLFGISTYMFKWLSDKLHLSWLSLNYLTAARVAELIVYSGLSVHRYAWLPCMIGLVAAAGAATRAAEEAAIRIAIVAVLQSEGEEPVSRVSHVGPLQAEETHETTHGTTPSDQSGQTQRSANIQ